MTEEIWKDIYYNDSKVEDYQISNKGRVKRLAKYVYWNISKDKTKPKVKRWLKEHILSPINSGQEGVRYKMVILYGKQLKVHKLVALHFVDNPKNYPVINHIDGDKFNNNWTNLEWCTHSHNTLHAFDMGMMKSRLGKDNNKTSTNEEQVLIVKEQILNGLKINEISKNKRKINKKSPECSN